MSASGVTRVTEARAVDELLAAAAAGPAGLIIEGEPGIGKTTLWMAGIDRAQQREFQVLSARPAATESVLAYATLSDLLSAVAPEVFTELPRPQRHAVDRILLRSDGDGTATDRRAVAAAFLSVVERLTQSSSVLLAIDDLQWVDPSSVHVLTFAARRTSGRVAVLGAVRTSQTTSPASWLQLPRPDQLRRITLQPLSLGALHAIVSERLGRSFSRPTMLRIFAISGGNPFYAMELARSIDDDPAHAAESLPGSLSELVEARLGSVDVAAAAALLAASCLAAPTIDAVADAVGTDPATLITLLEAVEEQGILTLEGGSIRFSHPLLARGVYTRAHAADRRAMHRRLADIVSETELRARHLALATTKADPTTLHTLDAAAEIARGRGAPDASAELLGLAVSLGGDTPERRIRLASAHFTAGDAEQARVQLIGTIEQLPAGPLRARAKNLLGVVHMFDDSFIDAAEVLATALDEVDDDPAMRVELLVLLAFAYVNAGRADEALHTAVEAVALAETCQAPTLLSQALGMQVTLRFMAGEGIDQDAMDRALALEDRGAGIPMALRPSAQSAMLSAWSGRLVEGGEALDALRRSSVERGEDSELTFLDFHFMLAAIWRADFAVAARAVEHTDELARQLNGDVPRYVALITRALLDAFSGDVDAARDHATEALAAGTRSGAANLSQWPLMTIGFLEVSLERYEAALDVLDPLLRRLQDMPDVTEIIGAWFLPDAVEAMIQLGRLQEAEPWVELLGRNGKRLDRPWMLAVGERCRGMLLAAHGEFDEAIRAAEQALVHHDRIPMPFDRARTLLLLGALQRRARQQGGAATTLREALDEFERLGTPLWVARTRAHLDRANVGPRRHATELTPSELRVAELAASGMTNRDVAATLFISSKTVEANLSRVYRKLGIHSRAELGRRMVDRSG